LEGGQTGKGKLSLSGDFVSDDEDVVVGGLVRMRSTLPEFGNKGLREDLEDNLCDSLTALDTAGSSIKAFNEDKVFDLEDGRLKIFIEDDIDFEKESDDSMVLISKAKAKPFQKPSKADSKQRFRGGGGSNRAAVSRAMARNSPTGNKRTTSSKKKTGMIARGDDAMDIDDMDDIDELQMDLPEYMI
ncbi:hypothetical protein RUND412_007086, partial [Rhizina undulata]